MNSSRFRGIVLWAGSAVLFALLLSELVRNRGPIAFAAPATIVSNGVPGMRGSENVFRFLASIRPRLAPGDRIVIVGRPEEGVTPFLIAVGQLPEQIVLPELVLASTTDPPKWVACAGRGCGDPRYRVVESDPGGLLLERKP